MPGRRGVTTKVARFTVHTCPPDGRRGSRLIVLLFSLYHLGNKEFAPDLCAIALGVLQELDEFCIRFRI